MKKIIVYAIALFNSSILFSEDTNFFRNGGKQNVKLEEIGINEIKYRRTSNSTGPLYTVTKENVWLIKYSNGSTDSIKYAKEPEMMLPPNNNKIILRSGKFYANNKALSANRLIKLCEQASPEKKSTELINLILKTKSSYKVQCILGVAGVPFLAAGAFFFLGAAGASFSDGPVNETLINNLLAVSAIGFVCATAFEIPSCIYGSKTHRNRKKMAETYNKNIL